MKQVIYILTFLLIATTSFAQLAGKKFIQGNALINFQNQEYTGNQQNLTSNGYGYSFDILLGKFKRENYATGWLLGSELSGGKSNYLLYANGETNPVQKSGISKMGFSAGRFWNFYKPFTEKLGIYGGPNVRLSYTYGNSYGTANSENEQFLTQTKTNAVRLSLGLSGSIYYSLSERWWLEASLAYANPFFLEFSEMKNGKAGDLNLDSKSFQYQLNPQLTLPSVGLGLRYFLK